MPNPKTWTRYDWLWICWILAFLGIEIPALYDKQKGNTFSEAWWWLIGIGPPTNKHVREFRALLFGFSAWLAIHLWTKRV